MTNKGMPDLAGSERSMKSDEVRKNWREVLEGIRADGTVVVVEHYNRPVARITPLSRVTATQAMSNTELAEQHLSYGAGNHAATDEEVWTRFPDLRRAYGRMQAMHQAFTQQRAEAGPIDLDELPPPTPGIAEALDAYEAEVRRLASIAPPPISFDAAELEVFAEALRVYREKLGEDLHAMDDIAVKNIFHGQIQAVDGLVARIHILAEDGDPTEPGYRE